MAARNSRQTIQLLSCIRDALTNLSNRRLLFERCNQIAHSSARHKDHGAILCIDLERFKTLNDIRGHNAGDLLLVEVTRRLLSCVRTEDTVARMGGRRICRGDE